MPELSGMHVPELRIRKMMEEITGEGCGGGAL